MLTIIKVFIILFLFCMWEQKHPVNFQNKSVYKLSFQLIFQIYSLLAQTEGKERPFLKDARRGTTLQYYHFVDISKR